MGTLEIDSKKYKDEGYAIVKSFFSEPEVLDINRSVDNLQPKAFIPYTNTPLGYGNLLGDENFKQIYENNTISRFCKDFLTENFTFNHLIVHNKPAWVGIGHEWHQESINIRSFAPGLEWNNSWKDFVQVFIPLDRHSLENGCLKIIPGSHKLGLLEHEDIVAGHFGHKRRIKESELERALESSYILNCELEPGDLLVFNHLIAHGSSNNNSGKRRRVAVMQARRDDFKKDSGILSREMQYRVDFTINSLAKKLDNLKTQREKYYEEVTKYTLKSREDNEN